MTIFTLSLFLTRLTYIVLSATRYIARLFWNRIHQLLNVFNGLNLDFYGAYMYGNVNDGFKYPVSCLNHRDEKEIGSFAETMNIMRS